MDSMTDLERVARAICPLVKPWMDDPSVVQDGKCECVAKVETPHGTGTRGCYLACEEIARATLEALLEPSDGALKAATDAMDIAVSGHERFHAGLNALIRHILEGK